MLTEHFSLITDASTYSLIVDALLHDGPASIARSGAREACTASPLNPSALAAFDRLARELPGILEDSFANGPPELPLVSEEPPLKPYVGDGPRRRRQDDAHSPSRSAHAGRDPGRPTPADTHKGDGRGRAVRSQFATLALGDVGRRRRDHQRGGLWVGLSEEV